MIEGRLLLTYLMVAMVTLLTYLMVAMVTQTIKLNQVEYNVKVLLIIGATRAAEIKVCKIRLICCYRLPLMVCYMINLLLLIATLHFCHKRVKYL